MIRSVLGLVLAALCVGAQERTVIRVDAGARIGSWKPVWAWFGYDEPNYTYTANGRKLIGQLVAASPTPVYFRAHNLLTTGDGTAALKWGSTNVYAEDASGRPVYNWTILDRIFDTWINLGAKPLVEIGFTPQALSPNPVPYRHDWPRTKIAAGWAYPPRDTARWSELIHQWVRHSISRYGAAEVESWYWELWNEPDIEYWQGTPEQYYSLYDVTADAIKRALPRARVGGPGTTGPASPKAAAWLRGFLDHCAKGINSATGRPGVPLDFISFHAKGRPTLTGTQVQMGLQKNLQDVAQGLEIVSAYPAFQALPILLTESDPEGCAACSAKTTPQNAYRNGTMYPAYTAAALHGILQLAARRNLSVDALLTWAFLFEGQPYFAGFRTLATNGIAKPVLNLFRMFGLMSGDRVVVESEGALPLDQILASGVRSQPDINGMATRSEREVSVLVWNYHDSEAPADDASVSVPIRGLPVTGNRIQLRHYRIDGSHSNAYAAWRSMGSPQQPSSEQYSALQKASELQLVGSPRYLSVNNGETTIDFDLPRHGLSLLQLSW